MLCGVCSFEELLEFQYQWLSQKDLNWNRCKLGHIRHQMYQLSWRQTFTMMLEAISRPLMSMPLRFVSYDTSLNKPPTEWEWLNCGKKKPMYFSKIKNVKKPELIFSHCCKVVYRVARSAEKNKKAQLSLTNPRDAKACQNCSNSTCLQRCCWQYWPIFMHLTAITSEIPRNSLKIQTYGVQGHPRSSILVSIESPCTTSY